MFSAEIPGNSAYIEQQKKSWAYLQSVILTPNHPRFPEFKHVASDAQKKLERMEAMRQAPFTKETPGMIDNMVSHLGTLWDNAMDLRGRMACSYIRSSLGVPEGMSVEQFYEAKIDAVMKPEVPETKEMEAVKKKLLGIAKIFDTEPEKVLQSFSKIDKGTRVFLEDLKVQGTSKGLALIADEFLTGIKAIEAVNPYQSQAAANYQKYLDSNAMDWRPLQTILFGGSMFLMGVGLVRAAVRKDFKFDPAMGFWAGVAAFCHPQLRNQIVQSMPAKGVEQLAKFDTSGIQATSDGFRGKDGAEAAQALQDIRKDTKQLKQMAELAYSPTPLTELDIGTLAGEGTPLFRALKGVPEALRSAALRTLGLQKFSRSDMELLSKIIEFRDPKARDIALANATPPPSKIPS